MGGLWIASEQHPPPRDAKMLTDNYDSPHCAIRWVRFNMNPNKGTLFMLIYPQRPTSFSHTDRRMPSATRHAKGSMQGVKAYLRDFKATTSVAAGFTSLDTYMKDMDRLWQSRRTTFRMVESVSMQPFIREGRLSSWASRITTRRIDNVSRTYVL